MLEWDLVFFFFGLCVIWGLFLGVGGWGGRGGCSCLKF